MNSYMERKRFDVIILMAGSGVRSGLLYNKTLYRINNKPIFVYSLEKFQKNEACENIILVYKDNDLEEIKKILTDYDSKKIIFVNGGDTRQDSVYNGLLACINEMVLIHDGARPLVTMDEINSTYEELCCGNVCTCGYQAKDTIKEMTDVCKTLDRKNLFIVSTPQGVFKEKMINAIKKARLDNYVGYDDVSLLEKYYQYVPKIVGNNSYNIKATTMEDIKIISLIIGDKNV